MEQRVKTMNLAEEADVNQFLFQFDLNLFKTTSLTFDYILYGS